MDFTAKSHVLFDERLPICGVVRCYGFQSDPSGFVAWEPLNGADNEDLADRTVAAPSDYGLGVCPECDLRLIDLHLSFQRSAIRIDHSSTELVEQQPGSLVGAEPEFRLELELELERGDRVGVGCHKVSCEELCAQRQVRPVHHRACDHGCLAPASRAVR